VLVGALLLVRPLIFTVVGPRDDSDYAVASATEIGDQPIEKELPLNASHGLLGEHTMDGHPAISVVISRTVAGTYAVVNAWSPASHCAVTIQADRLADCKEHTWTFDGDPYVTVDPPLQRFPTVIDTGAVVADFTHPLNPGS
jgi:hypothetical protein